MRTLIKIFPQEALDALAKSVADEVHRQTKVIVGYAAREKPPFQRVEFTFKFGGDERYSFPTVSSIELAKGEWQAVYETLVRKVLADTAPWALAKRLYDLRHGAGPEIPIYVDQSGKRHHTLKAETGLIGANGGILKMRMNDEQTNHA